MMKLNRSPRSTSTGGYGRIPIRTALVAGSCLAALALLASPARAQVFQIQLNKTVNGTSPAGPGPWMSLLIADIGGPGDGVSIRFEPELAAGEFITKAGLNLTDESPNPTPDPFAGLNVSCSEEPVGSTVCSNYNYVAQVDGYNIEGAAVGGFDLGFNFTGTGQNGGSGRLTDGKIVSFNLTGTTLSAEDLLGTIVVQGFDVTAAAKVQGIATGGGSGVIGGEEGPDPGPTPVPGPLPIVGAAAAFQASRRLRSRLKSVAVASRPA